MSNRVTVRYGTERDEIIGRNDDGGWAGFHFNFPSLGYVEKDGAKYRLVPTAWSPVI
jgi:hypothetical protein